MDVSAIASSAANSTSDLSSSQYGTGVMRKILDIQEVQGAQLAQMVAQASGLGRNMDASA